MMGRNPSWALPLALSLFFLSACQSKKKEQGIADWCAPKALQQSSSGPSGDAQIFNPDPIASSGDPFLSPSSNSLDQHRSSAELQNLTGAGVLNGTYAQVYNFLDCNMAYGAFDSENNFNYEHKDRRFQEVMSYYFTDSYRNFLKDQDALESPDQITVVAHCMNDDNAFFLKLGPGQRFVCLGDSVSSPGSSYADDASVVIHELQHATTTDSYSVTQGLNQFFYDEAGAINESLSDAMSLIYLSPSTHPSLDPRVFSRWALGSFGDDNSSRTAQGCPEYDASYANSCSSFPQFSADQQSISYVYPDGVGWPFGKNVIGSGPLRITFNSYLGQEAIHNTGQVLTGALYDAYQALLSRYAGNPDLARGLMAKVINEAIKHLPKPSSTQKSPVTFSGYAQQLLTWAPVVGFDSQDLESLRSALRDRGLVETPQLGNNWASVGPGETITPGMKIIDNPTQIKNWYFFAGGDSEQVENSITTHNHRISARETVLLWFDLENLDALTAGSVMLTIRSENAKITFPSGGNFGWLGSRDVQILYSKVNGTQIVNQLSSSNPNLNIATGNTYFKTNPHFSARFQTGIWVKAASDLAPGEDFQFTVNINAANAPAQQVIFSGQAQ